MISIVIGWLENPGVTDEYLYKMKNCCYNKNDVQERSLDDQRNNLAMEISPIAACNCRMHSWSKSDERQLKALKCMQHQYLNHIIQLRMKKWEDLKKKYANKSMTWNENIRETCNSAEMKPSEGYPAVLSPYSLCWWQQPDPVIPPLHTGLISRYGYEYRLPYPQCDHSHCEPLKIGPIIGPAKLPSFDRAQKTLVPYWGDCSRVTEYEDSISYTGYLLLRNAKQYAEPLPSSRRWRGKRKS